MCVCVYFILCPIGLFLVPWRTQVFSKICKTWEAMDLILPFWLLKCCKCIWIQTHSSLPKLVHSVCSTVLSITGKEEKKIDLFLSWRHWHKENTKPSSGIWSESANSILYATNSSIIYIYIYIYYKKLFSRKNKADLMWHLIWVEKGEGIPDNTAPKSYLLFLLRTTIEPSVWIWGLNWR